jgi:hypothetical protein
VTELRHNSDRCASELRELPMAITEENVVLKNFRSEDGWGGMED